MSCDLAISVEGLNKCFHIYESPSHRLQQFIFPRLDRILRRDPRAYFREFWALRDVSFEVRRGETVGIVGKNGAGKSTLLQILTGTLAPTSGSVQVRGRIAAMLELGAGFNPEFTGLENVFLNGALIGMTKEEINARLDDILAFADIGDFIHQPVKTYSSGMFVRLAFAIQANVDPEILIVDEALAVGDAQFVHRCMYRFHQLQEMGTTILFVSHDASAVKRLCDRALWFKGGRLAASGDSVVVVDAYLSDLFLKASTAEEGAGGGSSGEPAASEGETPDSGELPAGDRREGGRLIEFVSMRVRGSRGRAIDAVGWGDVFHLHVRIRNNSVPAGETLCLGYIVRDPRGIEIASTNTRIEGIELVVPEPGEELGVEFSVTLPMISPGDYSITPSVSVVERSGDFLIMDRIVNALLLTVTADAPIYTPIRFPTRINVHPG